MNARDYSFLMQAAMAANAGYQYHMLFDGLNVELIQDMVFFGNSNKTSSKSGGDDLIFKTTPKFNL